MTSRTTVTCKVCKHSFHVAEEIEKSNLEDWICPGCAPKGISLELLDFIKQRIELTRTEDENYSRFVLRELVQNADDAKASIIVLRFEADALCVANDGRAFTAVEGGDYNRISLILKRHQAEDKEATGHFGSGFQTVYALTNAPEVHSGGRSGRMNPVAKNWDYMDSSDSNRLISPYVWKSSSKGVLFRFPWRDNRRAKETYGGSQPFLNPNEWPRWNSREQREMYDDLRNYVHQVLLCCNHLSCVRLIWIGEASEAYQAERDFTLKEEDSGHRRVSVREGYANVPEKWFEWQDRTHAESTRDWNSYQLEGWKWAKGSGTLSYLLCSGKVSNERGTTQYIGKSSGGRVTVTSDPTEIGPPLKRSDIHLLLPLFDAQKFPGEGGKAYLYSTIPLPKRSGNWFVFTGHFFPEEGRKDVAITSLDGMSGRWHQLIVRSLARLYMGIFSEFIREVQELDDCDQDTRQRIILNSVPGIHLSEWMRPGKETSRTWAQDLHGVLVAKILKLPVLWTGHSWCNPEAAYWPRSGEGIDTEGIRTLEIMGEAALTKEFLEHPSCEFSLRTSLHTRELSPELFGKLFWTFYNSNKGPDEALRYGQKLKSGFVLDREEAMTIIQYCIIRENSWKQTKDLPIVPGVDMTPRTIDSYSIIPNDFEPLRKVLVPSMMIHPDFEEVLRSVNIGTRTMSPDDVVKTVSRIAQLDPGRYGRLSDNDHVTISRILVALASHDDFSLKQSHVELSFIPVRYKGDIMLSRPNSAAVEGGGRMIFKDKRAENYKRDFIFRFSEKGVPGLSKRVMDRIRYLDLKEVDEEESELVCEKLNLWGLEEGNVPTNFIRHFLSDRHRSLFRDEALSKFLELDDSETLNREKREFLEAIRVYYHHERLGRIEDSDILGKTEKWLRPDQMGEIPLLYDSGGVWDKPRYFAIEMAQEVELLQYRKLHDDFRNWHHDTLLAIGVSRRPESRLIVEVVERLVESPGKHRKALADVVALLLTSETPWADPLSELRDLQWIPSRDGLTRKPGDAVLPSRANLEILGKDYPGLFDIESCSPGFGSKLSQAIADPDFSTEIVEKRSREVGISTEASIEVLLAYVDQLAQDSRPPPHDLFGLLSARIESLKPGSIHKGHYFMNGSWIEGSRILISGDKTLSQLLGASHYVIDPIAVQRETPYLTYIGARTELRAEDLLSSLQVMCEKTGTDSVDNIRSMMTVWSYLENVSEKITTSLRERYGSRIMYPVGDKLAPVDRILVCESRVDDELFRSSGWYGRFCEFGLSQCQHPSSLKALGARPVGDLSVEDIRAIIESMSIECGSDADVRHAETIVRLLRGIYRIDPIARLGDAKIWPVRRGRLFGVSDLAHCYVRDDPAAVNFEDSLPFLYGFADGRLVREVYELAYAQTDFVRLFSRMVKKDLIHGGRENDVDGTVRLHLMAQALRSSFPDAYNKSPECIDWLAESRMIKVESLHVRMSLGDVSEQFDASCILQYDGQPTILRLGSHSTLYYDLAKLIVNQCAEKGFGEVAQTDEDEKCAPGTFATYTTQDFEKLVYYMLTRDPVEWHDFVQGLEPLNESLTPLMEDYVEIKPGWSQVCQLFMEIYGYCQICGRRTPASEDAGKTCERVKSIVSLRGGRYRGDFDEYSLSNSLFLCPSHYTLYERGLIRFPDIEGGNLSPDERASRLMKMSSEWDESASNLRVEVFETEMNKEPKWIIRRLHLSPGHAKQMLNWLLQWVRRQSA